MKENNFPQNNNNKKKKKNYFCIVYLRGKSHTVSHNGLFTEKTKAQVQKQKVSFIMLALLVPPLASSPVPKGMTNCCPNFTTAFINGDCSPIIVPEKHLSLVREL